MCHIEGAPGAPCHDKPWEYSCVQKLSQSILRLSVRLLMDEMCGFWGRGVFKTFYITVTIRNQGIFWHNLHKKVNWN